MFVDWHPFFQKKIKEDLEIIELSDNEKEVFEFVYLLGFIMSIFDSMKLLRQTKNLDFMDFRAQNQLAFGAVSI